MKITIELELESLEDLGNLQSALSKLGGNPQAKVAQTAELKLDSKAPDKPIKQAIAEAEEKQAEKEAPVAPKKETKAEAPKKTEKVEPKEPETPKIGLEELRPLQREILEIGEEGKSFLRDTLTKLGKAKSIVALEEKYHQDYFDAMTEYLAENTVNLD